MDPAAPLKRRVLVSGATGFIGRWSVRTLLARGFEVHAVGRRLSASGDDAASKLAGAVRHALDLHDAVAVRALLAELRPTHLLHFAWCTEPGIYWGSPENYRWTASSLQLLEAFAEVGGARAVLAGSCAEYDWSCASPLDERESPLAIDDGRQATPYATTKIALQKMLESWGVATHTSTAWGRIFFQYGPHEHPQRLVASVVRALLDGRAAECTAGRQVRSFLHVSDVGDAFAALLDTAVEGPVNIGGGDPLTIAELVEEVAEIVGRPDLLRLGARKTPDGEPAVLLPKLDRLHHEVGWKPSIPLRQGLESVVDWWRARSPGASA